MRALGRAIFRFLGWRMGENIPSLEKCIILVTPHTSNWDFFIALLVRAFINKPVKFMAKHQLFFFPLSLFMRFLGGIPVNRGKHNNLVSVSVTLFKQNSPLYLVIAPEGTRKTVNRWKMGFYYIAKKSNVPFIVMGLDYKEKVVKFSPPISPTEDEQKDIQTMIDFANQCHGKHPQPLPKYRVSK